MNGVMTSAGSQQSDMQVWVASRGPAVGSRKRQNRRRTRRFGSTAVRADGDTGSARWRVARQVRWSPTPIDPTGGGS